MKRYTIEEINNNKNLVIYFDNKDEWIKVKESKFGHNLASYNKNKCYSLNDRSYSSSSSETNSGAYQGATIVKFSQIDFQEELINELYIW